MPGSTTSSGDHKAKATDSSGVSNGIFVRPVAVAGIFRPVSESTKPALPEKRRFSALVGDLRPCSSEGPADEDFARRRQSWDTRQKEVPFGQNLLKKTPRNAAKPSPDSVKESSSTVVENGSASAPVTEPNTSAVANKVDSKAASSQSDIKSAATTNVTQISTCALELKTSSVSTQNNAFASTNSNHIESRQEKSAQKKTHETKSSEIKETDISPQKINVIKTSTQSTLAALKSKTLANISEPKKVSAVPNKQSSVQNDAKVDLSKSKQEINIALEPDSVKAVNTKVYGVKRDNKTATTVTTIKSDVIDDKKLANSNNSDKVNNKPKVYGIKFEAAKSETQVNKATVNSESESTKSKTLIHTKSEIKLKTNEEKHQNTSKPSDTPNLKSKVSEQPKFDTNLDIPKTSSNQNVLKSQPETKTKPIVFEHLKSKNSSNSELTATFSNDSKQLKSETLKSEANEEKNNQNALKNTPESAASKPKIYGLTKTSKKDTDNKDKSISLAQSSQDETKTATTSSAKAEDGKQSIIVSDPELLKDKNELSKTSSPPVQECRTIRRTSDVIAAKIQNIFQNFTSDKTAPPLPKKNKHPEKDKTTGNLQAPSVNKVENSQVSNTEIKVGTSQEVAEKTSIDKKPVYHQENQFNETKLQSNALDKRHLEGTKLEGRLLKDNDEQKLIPNQNITKPVANDSSPKSSETAANKLASGKSTHVVESSSNKPAIISTVNKLSTASNKNLQNISAERLSTSSANVKTGQQSNVNDPKKESEPIIPKSSTSNVAQKSSPKIQETKPDAEPLKKSENNFSAKASSTAKPMKPEDSRFSQQKIEETKTSIEKSSAKTEFISSPKTQSAILQSSKSNEAQNFQQKVQEIKVDVKQPVKSQEINCIKNNTSSEINGSVGSHSTPHNYGAVPKKKIFASQNLPSETFGSKQTKEAINDEKSTASQKKEITIDKESQSSSISNSQAQSIMPNQSPKTSAALIGPVNADDPKFVNGHMETKVEITKICPAPSQGIVPTVNVLFRTKSPQNTSKEENRKKVIIETTSFENGASDRSSTVLEKTIVPKIDDSELKSINEAMKTVEDVQKTLNMAAQPFVKHSLLDLGKQEGAAKDPTQKDETGKELTHNGQMQLVDLGDWNKKFTRTEPEVPRVPLRRRASSRDSLPPTIPLRPPGISRIGSLKRVDDVPRYVPRSPSQSCLSQRYSYTEMLSKVCSMGVIPQARSSVDLTPIAKSCSSSSSQVSELWSELSEEQSTATHASEMLEAETAERMRLEKEVQDLQSRYSHIQQKSDKMELEMMEARVYRSSELNGELSEDEDPEGNSSFYKQKYERAVRDMEIMKRRMQQQQEEEMEQKVMLKKASDKRLAEALEDVEEERQVANQWKRKAQKLGSELQDLRLMLEEQMARNGELEKKQRRFDAELSAAQEEIKKERLLREKLMREKDQALHEKYAIEQDLQAARLDIDMQHEKIAQLNRELDELTLSSKGEEEVTQLKRAKQELERKTRDQEEELEELAAQVQMLEQAKLRLEMSLEKLRQEHRRETSVREEEIEEIRASFSKKIKNLEAQLENEQDERHQLVKQKHELERRIYEMTDQPPPQDPEIERRLRRDLKRTKALLRDAQSMLEHTREGQSSKTVIRQLKNQLEDAEFAKAAAIKARQAADTELQELQIQLEEVTRAKNDAETRCLQLSREKSAIQTQLEEAEEEMAEVMKKYKAVVAQMSIDQKSMAEQTQQISELEAEKQMLKEQLNEVSHKFEHLAGQTEDTHKVHRLDGKIRDLESKLELEQTTRARLEHQISRLKEQNDRTREECDALRNKELQAQEGMRRLQRQIRDLREDYTALQQKEADAYRKQHELEMALENADTDLQVTKNDLRLACQRIQDLQNALEDDLDSGTDVPDDSGSDSDSSFDMSVLRNQSLTPVQRCESAASDYNFSIDGRRSRTSSFSQELSAFSSRNDVEKDIDGFSGLNNSNRISDTGYEEAA